jgi:hypothetical protein
MSVRPTPRRASGAYRHLFTGLAGDRPARQTGVCVCVCVCVCGRLNILRAGMVYEPLTTESGYGG